MNSHVPDLYQMIRISPILDARQRQIDFTWQAAQNVFERVAPVLNPNESYMLKADKAHLSLTPTILESFFGEMDVDGSR